MPSFSQLILLVLLVCCTATGHGQAQAGPLVLISPPDVLADYQLFLAQRDPLTITDFSGRHSRRDVVELVLVQQALQRGGCRQQVRFISGPTYLRILAELASGRAALSATTVWKHDLDQRAPALRPSLATVQQGQFSVGIYTATGNSKALAVDSRQALQQLTAVSNKNWVSDWQTLSALGLKDLFHNQQWLSMVRMVAAQRVDILLAPFQTSTDLALQVDDIRLLPIPRVKVQLQGSRHFAISRSYPGSTELAGCLNDGLKKLAEEGVINRAYRQSGFFHPAVADWQSLN